MPVAALPSSSTWRAPSAVVTVNGSEVSGLLEAEILSNNRLSADRFRIDLALGADPMTGPSFWSATPVLLVALSFSTDGGVFTEAIRGYVDRLSLDLARGQVRLEGRDLTSLFLESRLAQTFLNQTSSEIASTLAEGHGLAALVTPTTTLVGRYYHDQHDTLVLNRFSEAATEWDLLTFLARREGFDTFVSGSTLFFGPPQSSIAPRILRQQDVTSLRFERCANLSRGVAVTVRSWNSREGTAVSEVAQNTTSPFGVDSGLQSPQPLNFVILQPNLTAAQAGQLAKQRLTELMQHEQVVEISMPGDVTLSARDQIMIAGTNSGIDQTYQVDLIVRTIGRRGFRQTVRAMRPVQFPGFVPPAALSV